MKNKMVPAALILLACASAAFAGPSTAEILEKSDRARGKVPGLVWTVKLTDNQAGEAREEVLEVKARGTDALATHQLPPRIKGQKLLIVGRNMWFIKPGVSKAVPISPRQKLMGKAANGDIASTNYAGDYDASFAGEETLGKDPCYVLDLTAKTKNLTYDRIKYWVSKTSGLGMRADFYTVSGKKFKTALFEYANSVTINGAKIPFVSRMTIEDEIKPGESTVLEYSQVEVKTLPDSTFDLNLLLR